MSLDICVVEKNCFVSLSKFEEFYGFLSCWKNYFLSRKV